MSASAIAVCGKICSGKSFYAERLRRENRAVLLSVDEITLALFGQHIGERHDEICESAQRLLLQKSLEIIEIGGKIILDWGFWQKDEREYVRSFYESRGISFELHYIDTPNDEWRINIQKRNRAIEDGETSAYYVDDNLAEKFGRLFEPPDDSEIDVRVRFERE